MTSTRELRQIHNIDQNADAQDIVEHPAFEISIDWFQLLWTAEYGTQVTMNWAMSEGFEFDGDVETEEYLPYYDAYEFLFNQELARERKIAENELAARLQMTAKRDAEQRATIRKHVVDFVL